MRRLRVSEGLVLRVRDEGEAPPGSRRPALVCIHGAGASSVVWMDTVRRLSPRRRVMAPDLPGHGQSDLWPAHGEGPLSTVHRYRDAVGTACALAGIQERVVLMGHSLGGLVALAVAAEWPERVAGLVLVASGAKLPVLPEVLRAVEHDFVHLADTLRPLLFSPTTPEEIAGPWTSLLAVVPPEIAPQVTLEDFRAVAGFDATALAEKTRGPALVVGGEDDLLAPPATARDLAAKLHGDVTLTLVPRAAHLPMLEQPANFFSAVESFLTTV
jgi:pimeloyl-ACP methyl ester carboxylesterase